MPFLEIVLMYLNQSLELDSAHQSKVHHPMVKDRRKKLSYLQKNHDYVVQQEEEDVVDFVKTGA